MLPAALLPLRHPALTCTCARPALSSLPQGMDSSVRQMGNHLEFDPEWQTAFTLFGKLSIVIYHLIDWCSSDRLVLIKAYR